MPHSNCHSSRPKFSLQSFFIDLLPISLSCLCLPQLGHPSRPALVGLPTKVLEWSFILPSSISVDPYLLWYIRVIRVWCLPSSLCLLVPNPVAWQLACDRNNCKRACTYRASSRLFGTHTGWETMFAIMRQWSQWFKTGVPTTSYFHNSCGQSILLCICLYFSLFCIAYTWHPQHNSGCNFQKQFNSSLSSWSQRCHSFWYLRSGGCPAGPHSFYNH